MRISFAAPAVPDRGAVIVGVLADKKLTASAAQLDKKTGGALRRALGASRFTGKTNEVLEVLAPPKLKNTRVILAGLGDRKTLKDSDAENIGGSVYAHLAGCGETEAAWLADDLGKGALGCSELAAHLAFGARLRSYRFDKYKTKNAEETKPKLAKFSVLSADAKAAQRSFQVLEKIAAGVARTRDLVSEPANVVYPESFAAKVQDLSKLGIKIQVLGDKEMAKLGMNALLGVGQGSTHESKLLILSWEGAPNAKGEAKQPIAIVGKGVTFDTGGISIKPAAGMGDMKWDMGGAGVVAGLMHVLAARKAKVNVIGVCGLVENMPSGSAQRPGDIVTSMSGQTIEVLNTDAEGRLVLADALWYTQEKFKPRMIVDLATLTGAIIVSLGNLHAGLFGNDDDLCERLTAAGKAVGEPLWRMPLGPDYDKDIDSEAADMKNIGNGRAGGSITAAQFLQRFIKEGTPWAHLDIAGVTWSTKDKPTVPRGGTGFGVRLLDRMIRDHYETA